MTRTVEPTDPTRAWRVRIHMPVVRPVICALALGALVLAAPGCKKDKKKQTTPTPSATATPDDGGGDGVSRLGNSDPSWDADPVMRGGAGPDDPAPAGGDGGDGTDPALPGDPDDGSGREPGADLATIAPPTLDLPEDEVRRRVDEHLKAGRRAAVRNNPDDAIVEARKALEVDEVNVQAMVLLAYAYYQKGYYDKAEAILEIAEKREDGKREPTLHFIMGLVYEKTARARDAMVRYEKAVAINPNYKNALLNLGVHYLRNKRYDDAVRLYERLTQQLEDNRASTWTNLGSAYRGLSGESSGTSGDSGMRNRLLLKAETAFKQAISVDKNYPNAYYNLGLLFLDAEPYPQGDGDMDKLERLKRARTYFDEYRRLPGADAETVDEHDKVAKKLYDREFKRREKQRQREEKRKREADKGANG